MRFEHGKYNDELDTTISNLFYIFLFLSFFSGSFRCCFLKKNKLWFGGKYGEGNAEFFYWVDVTLYQ